MHQNKRENNEIVRSTAMNISPLFQLIAWSLLNFQFEKTNNIVMVIVNYSHIRER